MLSKSLGKWEEEGVPQLGAVSRKDLSCCLSWPWPCSFSQALESLNKKDIGEIKSYGRPPAQVEIVMQAVMILRGNEPTWAEAKRQTINEQ